MEKSRFRWINFRGQVNIPFALVQPLFGRFITLRLARVEAWWHFEKRSHHMPELLAVGPKSDRMGSTWKHYELPILDRKFPKEVEQVVLARDAVILATGNQHRRRYFQPGQRWATL
jgi:hypothetical protein